LHFPLSFETFVNIQRPIVSVVQKLLVILIKHSHFPVVICHILAEQVLSFAFIIIAVFKCLTDPTANTAIGGWSSTVII
jgi:hypothetical protein